MAIRTRNTTPVITVNLQGTYKAAYRAPGAPPPPLSAYAGNYTTTVSGKAPLQDEYIQDHIGKGLGKANKPCTHSYWSAAVPEPKLPWTYVPTSGTCLMGETPIGASWQAYGLRAHISVTPGLHALAIARIPAFAPETAQAAISYMEMGEIGDSLAAKAASALARVAYNVCRARADLKKRKFPKGLSRNIARSRYKREFAKEAAKISKAFAAVSSGKSTKHAMIQLVQDMASVDMEWKYGWKPLVGEVQAITKIAQGIDKLNARLVKGVRVYGRAVDVQTQSGSTGLYTITSAPLTFQASATWDKRTSTVVHASVVRALRPEYIQVENTLRNLRVVTEVAGLTPSLRKGWQLLPLSFVVDFFWPVSDLLQSLEGLHEPLPSYFTTSSHILTTRQETRVSGVLTCNRTVGTSPFSAYARHYFRTTPASFSGVPTLYIPSVRLPNSIGKWFSVCEIAFQRLAGRVIK